MRPCADASRHGGMCRNTWCLTAWRDDRCTVVTQQMGSQAGLSCAELKAIEHAVAQKVPDMPQQEHWAMFGSSLDPAVGCAGGGPDSFTRGA